MLHLLQVRIIENPAKIGAFQGFWPLSDVVTVHSERYLLVGGTRERPFDGIRFKLRKLLKNAPTPTTMAPALFAGDRVHAVLGAFWLRKTRELKKYSNKFLIS